MSSPVVLARERVQHALDSVDILRARLSGKKASDLVADDILLDACSYRICVIGEAIDMGKSHKPQAFASVAIKGTTWDSLVRVRNMFIHRYAMVSAQAVIEYAKSLNDIELALGNVIGQL